MPTTEKHLEAAARAIADTISARGNMPSTNFMQPERVDEARAAINAYLRSVLEGDAKKLCDELRHDADDVDQLSYGGKESYTGDNIRAGIALIESQAASLSEAQERCAGMEKALRDCRLELYWCAKQLAAKGLKGHVGDSVSRALAAADEALAALPQALPAQPPRPANCEDCPPVGYPTDRTRCSPCPRRSQPPLEDQ